MKKFNRAFTLIEVLILFTILSVILAASIPVLSGKNRSVPMKIQQGSYYCIADGSADGTFREVYFNKTDILSDRRVTRCVFNPPQKATIFRIDLIGAGAGGYDYVKVENPYPQTATKTYYTMSNGYSNNSNGTWKLLADSELFKFFNGKKIQVASKIPNGGKGQTIRYTGNNYMYDLPTGWKNNSNYYTYPLGSGTNGPLCSKNQSSTTYHTLSPNLIARYINANYCYNGGNCSGYYERRCYLNSMNEDDTCKSIKPKYSLTAGGLIDEAMVDLGQNDPEKDDIIINKLSLWYQNTGSNTALLNTLHPYHRDAICQWSFLPYRFPSGSMAYNPGVVKNEVPGGNGGNGGYITQEFTIPISTSKYNYSTYADLYKYISNNSQSGYCGTDTNARCVISGSSNFTIGKASDGQGHSNVYTYNGKWASSGTLEGSAGSASTRFAAVKTPLIDGNVLKIKYRSLYNQIVYNSNITTSENEKYCYRESSNSNATCILGNPTGGKGGKAEAKSNQDYSSYSANHSWDPDYIFTNTRGKNGFDVNGDTTSSGTSANPLNKRPALELKTTLTHRVYTLGGPGKSGNHVSKTRYTLNGPCNITISNGSDSYSGAIPQAGNLDTVLQCRDYQLTASGGQYTNSTTETYDYYTRGANISERTVSAEPAQNTDWWKSQVFFKFPEGIDLTNIGKGGEGPKFVDKCTVNSGNVKNSRYKGTYEVTVVNEDSGWSSAPYQNEASSYEKTEIPSNCIYIPEAGEVSALAQYGTKVGKYEHIHATRGHGGAVIVSW